MKYCESQATLALIAVNQCGESARDQNSRATERFSRESSANRGHKQDETRSSWQLLGLGPTQVMVEEREGAHAVDDVAAIEKLDRRPIRDAQRRVQAAHLG